MGPVDEGPAVGGVRPGDGEFGVSQAPIAWLAAHHAYAVAVDEAHAAIDAWKKEATAAKEIGYVVHGEERAAAYAQILAVGHPPVEPLVIAPRNRRPAAARQPQPGGCAQESARRPDPGTRRRRAPATPTVKENKVTNNDTPLPEVDVARYKAPRISVTPVTDVISSKPLNERRRPGHYQKVLLDTRTGELHLHEKTERLEPSAGRSRDEVPPGTWQPLVPGEGLLAGRAAHVVRAGAAVTVLGDRLRREGAALPGRRGR
ncbi:hypothetical protein [Streptomyces sp. KM273126]|uniref:hypothetical protein n=1 Tax=Streptomyces sp. KM273126 TaxID=2545247 RepID=UPI00215D9A7E|nr:hypothetical protein [Streptomyces sp. KM273126]